MTAPHRTRAALLVAGGLAAAVLSGCGSDSGGADASDTTPVDATTGAANGGSSAPSEDATPVDDPTPSATTTGTVAAPVYFTGATPAGPRLFREFRKVEADNPLEEAAALMVAGDALDPDYGTAFGGDGSFASVTYDEGAGRIVATLADATWTQRPAGMSATAAKLAAQQLVYTLDGIVQERVPVVVELDGSPAPLFGLSPTDGFTARASALTFVNVTTPEEGATVHTRFEAAGVADSFEANVPWEVRDDAGEVVLDGFVTAEAWGGKLYPFATTIDVSGLDAGTYTFVARTDDPSDGEGAGPTEDTKTITVR